jgi:DNA-binding GntR family transcriptional regulator
MAGRVDRGQTGERLRNEIPASRPRLQRRLLTEEVADTLRDMILVGELTPDRRFTQQELATLIGVSTMPVREALLKLSHEGLIRTSPNRSFRVVRTTREDIRDLYWVHATLAGELARRACEKSDDAFVKELRDVFDQNLEALRRADVEVMEEVNWAFHRMINQAAEAPKLLLLLRSTLRFIPQHFYALIPEWARVSERGHARIVKAFEEGDPNAAATAASEHVYQAGELLIKHFSETGYWTAPSGRA